MKIHNLSSDVYLAKKLYNFIGNCVYGSKLNYISNITGWCKRNVPCLKIPTLTAAMQWGLPWTAQSADFGKFYLNSLNLAPFLLLNPVYSFTADDLNHLKQGTTPKLATPLTLLNNYHPKKFVASDDYGRGAARLRSSSVTVATVQPPIGLDTPAR